MDQKPDLPVLTALGSGAFVLLHLTVIVRATLRRHREPTSRVAWGVVILMLPEG